MAVNILVFAQAERTGSTTDSATLIRWGASERSHVWGGEYWRFVTPMFLHIGAIHLIWNCYAQVGWCSGLERALGPRRLLLAYALSGIGASATSVLCHDAVSAGASGAGFGIVGVTLALLYRQLGGWSAFTADKGVRSTAVSLGIWTVLGLTAVNMDHFAHLGGLLSGLLIGAVVRTPDAASAVAPAPRTRLDGPRGWALVAVALVSVLVAAAYPRPGSGAAWAARNAHTTGHAALVRADHETAIAQFNRAEALGDRSPGLFYNRGIARRQRGDRAGAAADFERALQVAPAGWSHRRHAHEALTEARQPPSAPR